MNFSRRRNHHLKLVDLIVVFIGTIGLLAIYASSGFTITGTPRLKVPEQTHDFGKISEDQSPKYTFAVHNTGNAPLKILEVLPDCTCTVAKYDDTIGPGGSGAFTLSIKPYTLLNAFRKNTTIRTNDPENPEVVLTLQGVAEPLIAIEPSHVIRLKGNPGQDLQASVRLISRLPQPWKIAYFQTTIPDKIDVALKVEEPGKVYVVNVKNKSKEKGTYYGKIEIFNNFEPRPTLILRVFGNLQGQKAGKS